MIVANSIIYCLIVSNAHDKDNEPLIIKVLSFVSEIVTYYFSNNVFLDCINVLLVSGDLLLILKELRLMLVSRYAFFILTILELIMNT